MKPPEYHIIEGSPKWADKYREFCRKAYMDVYPNAERGITEELFSEEVFGTQRVKEYFQDLARNTEDHKLWLAVDENDEIIGGVAAQKYSDYCDIKAFYVRPDLKGQGIGRKLYEKVKEFASDMAMQVDVVEYLQDTIDMYKHWGFEVDESKGTINYPWEHWPEEARLAHRAIIMVKPASGSPPAR
jgi:GNAT superfamily N-acetyltransferase